MRSVEFARAARTAIEVCLGVRPGEQVLIVTDTLRPMTVPEALMGAAAAAGADAMLAIFQAPAQSPGEPPPAIAEALRRVDAAVLYTTASLSHSQARIQAQAAGTRVISAPGLSEDGFLRTLAVDMPALADLTNRVAQAVAESHHVRMRTKAGTDVEMDLAHPVTRADGLCRNRGDLDFFPPGLILSVPVAESVRGTAVVDGSVTHIGKLANPITVRFEAGRAVEIQGGAEAEKLRRMLAELDDPNVYNFAAWGVGTNPRAALIGDDPSFEGERVSGWGHLSTGSNAAFPGGTVRARLHLDLIITDPTVELDGCVVLERRTFCMRGDRSLARDGDSP
ncbi:MAG: aminopeptidase [Chloroflexi bacterium]|nr:aminopeptidase [Chloroflexota bacterium]